MNLIGWCNLIMDNLPNDFFVFIKLFCLFSMAQYAGFFSLIPQKKCQNILFNLSMATPISFSLFGVVWLFILFSNGVDDVLLREGITSHALILSGVGLLALKVISYYTCGFDFKASLLNIGAAFAVGVMAVMFQIVAPKYMIGDSIYLVNWLASASDLIDRGFPLFGLAIANLSLVISSDFYLNSFHNVMAMCMLIALTSFFLSGQFYENMIRRVEAKVGVYFSIFIVMVVFVYNGMFQRHIVYVNFHLYAACLILFPLLIFQNSNRTLNIQCVLTITLLLSALAMVRMEGVLFALIVLWQIYTHSEKERGMNILLVSSCLLMGCYIFFLQQYTTQDSFVSSALFGALIIISFGFAPMAIISTSFLEKKMLLIIILASSILVIIAMLAAKPSQMLWNIMIMAANMNPVFWGFLGMLVAFTAIYYTRDTLAMKDDYEIDVFGQFFILALLMTLMLTFFRSPLRLGMNDSVNRIMIQIVPAFLPVCVFYVSQNKAIHSISKKIFGC